MNLNTTWFLKPIAGIRRKTLDIQIHGAERSLISKEYANKFIREFILDVKD